MQAQSYRDAFVEQLIRCKRLGFEGFCKLGAVILGLVLVALSFHFLTSIFPFFFALICILIFFMFKYTVKEYEYSLIAGDFGIDIIRGKRKRKTVYTCSTKDIKELAPCGAESKKEGFSTVLDASIAVKSEDRWRMICEKEDGSRTLIYFNPNDRLKNALKPFLGARMDYTLPNEEASPEEVQ